MRQKDKLIALDKCRDIRYQPRQPSGNDNQQQQKIDEE